MRRAAVSLTSIRPRSVLNVEQLAVNTIKGLAMDAVQRANSGHPGMPMGMSDLGVVLWTRFLTVDPSEPEWFDRDRFVLSNGHGSMLLYSLLHLSGFPVSLDDIKSFRQLGSHTAGHPEIDHRLGIEMTTGPLGQGFGTAVGMAIAEEHLRSRLGSELVDHRTFAFVSDGDLMEGVASESASIAGNLGLGRLVYFYDDNEISIDGSTDITFTEDVPARFRAIGWHVVEIDGHDREAIFEATEFALAEKERPSLVVAHTVIASGAPNLAGTSKSHGAPLGEAEIRLTKEAMGFDPDVQFHVPESVYEFFSESMERGRDGRHDWERRRDSALQDPEVAGLWKALLNPDPVTLSTPQFDGPIATRAASGKLFPEIARKVPGFIGGSADLVESTKTQIEHGRLFSRSDRESRDIAFGIREHAMGTIVNGMAIHGGLRPYGATFFVFSDYMRPAVRLAALMRIPSIWVWTHDSIFLGEDGPTHQPIEHLASLRAMPGMWVVRPADATETVEAWELALNRSEGPTALVLTRQNLPVLEREPGGVARGGYVLRSGSDVVLVATGSEVALALETADLLEAEGASVRVVSLPCWEAFATQPESYREEVLGHGIPRVSLEAGSTFGWSAIVGVTGMSVGIDRFGASAPASALAEEFGYTADQVASRVKQLL